MRYGNLLRLGITALLAALPIAAQTPAGAQAPDKPADTAADKPAEPDGLPGPWVVKGLKFSGLVDFYGDINFNHPESRINQYRNFDVRANQFTLNMAKVTLEMDPAPIGFKLDFGFGRAFDIFNATEPGGPDFLKVLPQAYLSVKPPKFGGLQIDFGKFYTSAGAELTETHLNWNYSRAFAYANGPYYHFGIRATKPITSNWTLGGQLINGWNNVEDNNTGKTAGITSALTGKKASWFVNYYVGPEKTNSNEGIRNFFDTVLLLTPSDRVNAYVNYDYGHERLLSGQLADWVAIAVAAKFGLTNSISFSPRYEYYKDKAGFITGTQQNLQEFTLTGEYKWNKNFLSRLEYRRDWSDQTPFDRGSTPASYGSQNTILIGFIAVFGI